MVKLSSIKEWWPADVPINHLKTLSEYMKKKVIRAYSVKLGEEMKVRYSGLATNNLSQLQAKIF